MALVNSGRAIGAVSQLLHDRLLDALGSAVDDVTVGRPEPPPGAVNKLRLNIFLYEIHLDEYLRNHPLDEGQDAPLWLVLRYLLTAFDADGESDSIRAHELLGQGMRALNALNYLSLTSLPPATIEALDDNPDKLKLNFEAAPSDLLSRLMQGSDEKYRCSAAFEIRPVLVAPAETPTYSQLVGIDYTSAPSTIIGRKGVQLLALPSIGPSLDALDPLTFGLGNTVTLTGSGLGATVLSVNFGAAVFGATSQKEGTLTFVVSDSLADGATISAGSQVISVFESLPGGRTRTSNLIVGGLRPRLDTAVPSALVRTFPADPTKPVFGTLDLTGVLLGTADDEIYLAFHNGTAVVAMFDDFTITPGPPFQTKLRLKIPHEGALPPASYRLLLRVNGQQAVNSPLVAWKV
ncbi:MAG: Pvc16 family protein [Gemmatimonadaceae bacterium]